MDDLATPVDIRRVSFLGVTGLLPTRDVVKVFDTPQLSNFLHLQ
jgi:hypothetical protein